MLDKIKERVKPDDRIIMARKDILPLKFPVEQDDRATMKPKGLWYAIGLEWIEWVEGEMPDWIGDKFYKIEINLGKILKLDTMVKIIEFDRDYGKVEPRGYDKWIDWKTLAEKYSGIEIAPYQYSLRHRYMWYYGWDVASGCIWKEDAITKIFRIRV